VADNLQRMLAECLNSNVNFSSTRSGRSAGEGLLLEEPWGGVLPAPSHYPHSVSTLAAYHPTATVCELFPNTIRSNIGFSISEHAVANWRLTMIGRHDGLKRLASIFRYPTALIAAIPLPRSSSGSTDVSSANPFDPVRFHSSRSLATGER